MIIGKDFKYKLVKNFLTQEEIILLTDYCRIRHRINFDSFDSTQNDNGDTFFYGDPLMESLMVNKLNIMQKETGLELLCTYAFWRMYTVNADLKKHKDRPACEVSVTVQLGRSHNYSWPIYMGGTPVYMAEGDGIVYPGTDVQHWRDKCDGPDGYYSGQAFFHFVLKNGAHASQAIDKRNNDLYVKNRIVSLT